MSVVVLSVLFTELFNLIRFST